MRKYRKETGKKILESGCWLKRDRIKETSCWVQANAYNLLQQNGSLKYKTIGQIRDFYKWFDKERKRQGHEIEWVGFAAIASEQLAKTEADFTRVFIVHNKEVHAFVKIGSHAVLEFAFPLLREVYTSQTVLTGAKAKLWDATYGAIEQCEIIDPLYQNLSEKAVRKLNKMVKGKGVFQFGVPKELRYEGKIKIVKKGFTI